MAIHLPALQASFLSRTTKCSEVFHSVADSRKQKRALVRCSAKRKISFMDQILDYIEGALPLGLPIQSLLFLSSFCTSPFYSPRLSSRRFPWVLILSASQEGRNWGNGTGRLIFFLRMDPPQTQRQITQVRIILILHMTCRNALCFFSFHSWKVIAFPLISQFRRSQGCSFSDRWG